MNWKKLTAAAVTAGFLFGFGGLPEAQAMSREDIAKIKVSKSGNFKYWNKDAKSLTALKDFVKDVTDSTSPNFVPEKDRIAVFDMDGTLMEERAPYYTEWELYSIYVEENKDKISQADLEIAAEAKQRVATRTVTPEFFIKRDFSQSRVYAGLTPDEFEKIVQKSLEHNVSGMENMKHGESFFLPMVEVMSYLKANKFKLFICSGADRGVVRATVDGVLPVPLENMIGRDVGFYSEKQGDEPADIYVLQSKGDPLKRNNRRFLNAHSLKVHNIAREIGRAPILCFGNSSNDFSMFNYTLANSRYKKTMAFALLCDDLERDYGDEQVAARMKQRCDENGYVAISMRDDWKTIYGYDVPKSK